MVGNVTDLVFILLHTCQGWTKENWL